jgi:site-specific DNA-methyltransferase (adenine-specific)
VKLRQAIADEFGELWDPCPIGGKTGLIADWEPRVFCNPPYGAALPGWISKGAEEVDAGRVELIVWLLPARTDTRWFHDLILPRSSEIRFLRGRLHFNEGGRATFPSLISVWGGVLSPCNPY